MHVYHQLGLRGLIVKAPESRLLLYYLPPKEGAISTLIHHFPCLTQAHWTRIALHPHLREMYQMMELRYTAQRACFTINLQRHHGQTVVK
jgi:hypothetical protein